MQVKVNHETNNLLNIFSDSETKKVRYVIDAEVEKYGAMPTSSFFTVELNRYRLQQSEKLGQSFV